MSPMTTLQRDLLTLLALIFFGLALGAKISQWEHDHQTQAQR